MSDWLTIDEILSLDLKDFPKERSALSRKATREAWARRRRDTPGRRGVTYEYQIPQATAGQGATTTATKLEGLVTLLEALTEDELEILINTIKRKGVESLLYLSNDCNHAILQLPDSIKASIIETYISLPPRKAEAKPTGEEDKKIYPGENEKAQAGSILASEKKRAG